MADSTADPAPPSDVTAADPGAATQAPQPLTLNPGPAGIFAAAGSAADAVSATEPGGSPSTPGTPGTPSQAPLSPGQISRAALICGFTAQDAPRQMTDAELARYFGYSPSIIAASPDDFYRRWVIENPRDALTNSPDTCLKILGTPSSAPALLATLLGDRATAEQTYPPSNQKVLFAPEPGFHGSNRISFLPRPKTRRAFGPLRIRNVGFAAHYADQQ